MTSPATTRPLDDITVVAPRQSVVAHLRSVWANQELLVALVRKELKVKYKNSSLGFVWSLLNPLLYLVVYYYVFQVMLGSGIDNFPIFLLSGLLIWTLFSTALNAGAQSIVANGGLVKKVCFPREVLPLSVVGAALVHFLLQFMVLVAALVAFRWSVDPAYVWLVIPGLFVTLLLGSALGIVLAAANVYARDTQHLLEIVTLLWFWLTPIVYPYVLVTDKLTSYGLSNLALLNPMTSVTLAFQKGIYGRTYGSNGTVILPPDADALWYIRNLAIVGIFAMVLLVVAIRLFDQAEGSFAEEI